MLSPLILYHITDKVKAFAGKALSKIGWRHLHSQDPNQPDLQIPAQEDGADDGDAGAVAGTKEPESGGSEDDFDVLSGSAIDGWAKERV